VKKQFVCKGCGYHVCKDHMSIIVTCDACKNKDEVTCDACKNKDETDESD